MSYIQQFHIDRVHSSYSPSESFHSRLLGRQQRGWRKDLPSNRLSLVNEYEMMISKNDDDDDDDDCQGW